MNIGKSLEKDIPFDWATKPAAAANNVTTGNKVIRRISARSTGLRCAQKSRTVQPSIKAPAMRLT